MKLKYERRTIKNVIQYNRENTARIIEKKLASKNKRKIGFGKMNNIKTLKDEIEALNKTKNTWNIMYIKSTY